MPQDYNSTINLPQTKFEMRANLPQREPQMLENFENSDIYNNLMEKNKEKPLYVLHDGPPFANGDIHLGTALNKVLKDFIVKHKNMSGFKSPFVPGWDTHGLPIELKALKKIGADKNSISPLEIRKSCKEFAEFYKDNQLNQFKRLGVIGDYNNPYMTLHPEFESIQVKAFGEMAKKGYIYKGLKPVYWCPECQTALAEAEIEYDNSVCHSIYVKFKVNGDNGKLEQLGANLESTFFVIWTTTAWTLPGNVAICLGKDYEYSVVKVENEFLVIANELVEETMSNVGIENYEILGSIKGSELELITATHPFLDRNSLVILGDHVTLESGTGCVHTAPGHGVEDYEVCLKYSALEMPVPVDSKGVLTEDAGIFAGLKTANAGKAIVEHLEKTGNLLGIKKIEHQYPHCWRCSEPILFRATKQWFCSVEGFKDKAIEEVKKIEWIPGWGEERMIGMLRDRSDWCISRQRTWGVPFPVFYCKDCEKYIINDQTIDSVSEIFKKYGSDAWFSMEAKELLPKDFKCPECGCSEFTKETDTMDGWFDSGTTHLAVLKQRPELKWPADLYLEGNDQYRGWFQSSLLTSVAVTEQAPYKAVCTHGWVVDGEGKKMSKSLGNGIAPEDIIKEYGADILRLWVASSDYHADIRISKDILKQMSEVYRKIRNTARFILGNLSNFDPNKDMIEFDNMLEIDRWAMIKLDMLTKKVNSAYESFDFHIVYHAIHNFCVVEMSNFYLDILKDRLYCELPDGENRMSALSAMFHIVRALTLLVAPILAFTSNEIWEFVPAYKNDDKANVLYNEMPKSFDVSYDEKFLNKWDKIYLIREDVNKALEIKRANKEIGKSLEAKITLYCDEQNFDFVSENIDDITAACIVSEVEVSKGEGEFNGEYKGISISVSKVLYEKCERCWIFSITVGQDQEHKTLCSRCADVVKKL